VSEEAASSALAWGQMLAKREGIGDGGKARRKVDAGDLVGVRRWWWSRIR
jgi:hypothetical protein